MAVTQCPVTDRERPWICWLRRWPLFNQSRLLICFVGAAIGGVVLLLAAAATVTPVRTEEITTFAALVLGAGLCVEAMRRLGPPSGLTRDLLGAWWFPTVLLLPPMYSLLVPIPVYVLLQLRIRRTVVHRRVFNAASVALSGFVSSLLFHAVLADGLYPALVLSQQSVATSLVDGPGVLLALLCCAVFTVLNTGIMAVAVHVSAVHSSWNRLLWDREAVMIDGVELCVGITVAILSALSALFLLIALPPVLLLQRSLLFQQLQTAARTDPKTGLLNAATWEYVAEAELSRAVQDQRSAAVLIIDIDHFKRVNDTYGHLFGDHVLLSVASTLTHQLRSSDTLGRFGGEEFVALLPGADTAEACRAAERLRSRVGRMGMRAGDSGVSVTISVGVALLSVHGQDLVGLLAAADLAVYRAKDNGRNRVCLPVTGPSTIPGQRSGGGEELQKSGHPPSLYEP
ncbi:diguanylate cyclase (GGDEF)-like protein [Haloactinospora alba]|uniref:Diguanylate cyclase (GGDEF)-like protein n=1 Tax=Haloactinospora alba TaxID=405555 RepID=A0A543NKS2_9ACTN|nr:diguanylate cyclase (GGDEF)-like protein [Haloactinospora alba]